MRWIVCFLSAVLALGHADDYVTARGFIECAQFSYASENQEFFPEKVRNGDVVYVHTDVIQRFFRNWHPKISARYILITHASDFSCPRKCAAYLNDDKLIAWFGQNVEGYSHPKLIPIPIGLEVERTWEKGGAEILNEERRAAESTEKTQLLYMNFTAGRITQRIKLMRQFAKEDYCIKEPRKDYRSYLRDLAKTRFVLSPRGFGLDCFRTWEVLYMGTIPVVKASSMDPIFEGLPVVIVQDWKQVTEGFLRAKWAEMQGKSYTYEKLSMSYWRKLIDSYRANALKG